MPIIGSDTPMTLRDRVNRAIEITHNQNIQLRRALGEFESNDLKIAEATKERVFGNGIPGRLDELEDAMALHGTLIVDLHRYLGV